MTVSKGDKPPEVAPDHPDWPLESMLLMEALGTVSIDFLQGLMQQLANAGSPGREIDQAGLNFI